MKKLIIFGVSTILPFLVVSCSGETISKAEYDELNQKYTQLLEAEESSNNIALTADTTINTSNIDEFINSNAILVDVRNFEEYMNIGHILGFQSIPFYDYLEGNALVRNDDWEFSEDEIVNRDIIINAFGDDFERPIILICASGRRASYVKSALDSIGYKKVFNAGGFNDYNGKYIVLGDESYSNPMHIPTPEKDSVDMENLDKFLYRKNARYVDLRNFDDLFFDGYIRGFEAVPFYQYLENRAVKRNDSWNFTEEDIVNEEVIYNIFGNNFDTEIFLMCTTGTRSEYFKTVLETLGYNNVYNVGGFSDYKGFEVIVGDEQFALD